MDKPTPIEIAESIEALTLQQITDIIPQVDAEITWIKAHGDKTIVNTRRLRELQTYVNALTELHNEMLAPEPPKVELAAEVAPAAAEEPLTETEVAEAVAPAEVPADIEKMIEERIAAALVGHEAAKTEPVTDPAITEVALEEVEKPQSAMFANLDNTPTTDVSSLASAQPTTMDAVVAKFKSAAATIANWGTADGVHMFGEDKLAGIRAELGTLGKDAELNTALIRNAGSNPNAQPIMAALCGSMKEIRVDSDCYVVDASPFWDSFTNTMAADGCGVKFRKHLKPELIEDGAWIWDACKQGGINPADESTWKPMAKLPDADCGDYCEVQPFYVGTGLQVTVDQEFCEKDRIAEATQVIQAMRSRRLEQSALFIADKSSTLKTATFSPGIGLVPNLQLEITKLLVRQNVGSIRCVGDMTAYVPEYLRKLIALDMSLAGENDNQADARIRGMFAACGVTNVVFVDSWGCEGELVTADTSAQPEICGSDCTDLDLGTLDCAGLAFGTGAATEPLPNQASIRLLNPSDFVRGETGVIDWQLRKDNSSLRQNKGDYFAESRHLFFPKNDAKRFRLDLNGICANGNRVDRTGSVSC